MTAASRFNQALFYKGAAKYSLECKADTLVTIWIRKTDEIYIFDSSTKGLVGYTKVWWIH
jgi:hypothetical protein